MEEQVRSFVDDLIKEQGLVVSDVFKEEKEGKILLNIELDSDEVIDLNKITESSRIINEEIDKTDLLETIDELDIYSKEKGDSNE